MHKRNLCRHAVYMCVCLCASVTFVDNVKTNKDIRNFFSPSSSHTILVFPTKRHSNIPTRTPLRGVLNAGGVGINRDYEPISLKCLQPAVGAATCQVLSTGSPVDEGHRLASYDTTLVVSGGVDSGRRRRNVYDKKPRGYAKDNRSAHLTARSDKSAAY